MDGVFIERLRVFTKYLDELMEKTGITRDELLEGCESILYPTANDLLRIATNLNVDPILLWQGKLDLENIRSKRAKNFVLPSCYSGVQSSTMLSLRNILEQFKRHGIYDYALKRIQLDEDTMANNKSISVLAIMDLFDYSKNFFTEKDYQSFAKRNATFFHNDILKNEISRNASATKNMAHMFEHLSKLEKNWSYRILKVDHNTIKIQTAEREEMREAKNYRSYTNHISNYVRFSFMQNVAEIMNLNTQIQANDEWNNQSGKFTFNINIENKRPNLQLY